MEEDLKKLGLSWNETKVYLSLVKIGETPVGGIINDLKVHRQIIYNALDELEKRNMVTKTLRNKVNHYKITDPEILVENIRQQELIASRVSRRIEEELKQTKKEHEINIYNGKENIRRFFIKIFKEEPIGSTYYILGGQGKRLEEVLGEKFFYGEYDNVRKERKLHSKNILSETFRKDIGDFYQKLDTSIRETRYVSFESINPIITLIHDKSVCFMSLAEELFVIEIRNKSLRDAQLEHFNLLWNIAKE